MVVLVRVVIVVSLVRVVIVVLLVTVVIVICCQDPHSSGFMIELTPDRDEQSDAPPCTRYIYHNLFNQLCFARVWPICCGLGIIVNSG